MDFAYLNAVLKSNIFPPYDPWYLGGYLNYYYYGFLIVGGLVKWLGIVPSVAYNLILPTMFSLIAIGAFSIAWNLVTAKGSKSIIPDQGEHVSKNNRNIIPYIAGIAGAVGMALLGNLGTIKMFIIGFQKLASPGAEYVGMPFFTRLVWTIEGFFKAVTGATIPYSLGDWYWLPSRIIPAAGDIEPITEFPFFTVLYGDPHAHLFALPVSLLAISLALSVVLARGIWHNKLSTVIGFIFAGLVIGALRPTNTWDFPTYLLLGMIAFGYGLWRYQSNSDWSENLAILNQLPEGLRKIIRVLAGMLVLVGLAFLLYQPYAQWYALGYSKIGLWQGTRTPLHAYFLHWGLFLFVITSWLIWESIDWMANTPVSALQKLAKHKQIIWIIMIILVLLTILLGINFPDAQGLPFGNGVNVAWIALPIAAWAGILILRPALSDAKRFVLFLIGTGLVLTIMVEVIVLQGDIGRMNTVFKFYLQVWTILSISAAASLGWVLSKMPYWSPKLRNAWQIIFVLIVAGTAMYPLMATWAKITDRMAPEAPKSLDGMIYMDYATYLDDWGVMDLSEDYRAIRWLQENISDNPVIVEANLRNLYRWGSRMSIYTGLPNVVGWEWHQQQQRAILPGSWVTDRIYEIDNFYTTQDPIEAKNFLDKYNIRYIILGQQERGHYKGPGLDKFDQHNDILWKEIYKDGDTIIYEVISSSS